MSIQLYALWCDYDCSLCDDPDERGAWVKTEDLQTIGWMQAVDDQMLVTHLGVANVQDSAEVAKKKLQSLIQWHIDVALDPCVNGGYKLVKVEE